MATFQALVKQTQSISAPPQNLYPISRAAPKHEEMSAEGVFRQLRLYECRQSIESLAHVG
jgi:hypothetical protein